MTSSAKEHEAHVKEVLRRLQRAGFTLNSEKVVFGATEIKYLGHLLSAPGVKILPDRVTAIQRYPRPTNLRSLRFMGMVGFYACFIPGYGEVPFVRSEEHQQTDSRQPENSTSRS
jgi:hypothetical protein